MRAIGIALTLLLLLGSIGSVGYFSYDYGVVEGRYSERTVALKEFRDAANARGLGFYDESTGAWSFAPDELVVQRYLIKRAQSEIQLRQEKQADSAPRERQL